MSASRKKLFVKTFGCQMNVYDSGRMIDALAGEGYDSTDRLEEAEAKVGRKEAVLSGTGTLEGIEVALAVMDFRFVGGSMGSVVGEKIARAGRVALERKQPLIVVSASAVRWSTLPSASKPMYFSNAITACLVVNP